MEALAAEKVRARTAPGMSALVSRAAPKGRRRKGSGIMGLSVGAVARPEKGSSRGAIMTYGPRSVSALARPSGLPHQPIDRDAPRRALRALALRDDAQCSSRPPIRRIRAERPRDRRRDVEDAHVAVERAPGDAAADHQ